MGLPVVVAGEAADLRLGPVNTTIARARDKGVDRPAGVPAVRRVAGREVRCVARIVSRIVEDDRDHAIRGGDVRHVLMAASVRVDRGDRRPIRAVRRVTHEDL